jgi:hypothetical protein
VRQQQERQAASVKLLTNQFINTFTNHQHEKMAQVDEAEKQPLMVERICKINKTYRNTVISLEIKVGHKRTYVVKNIQDFLQAIKAIQTTAHPFDWSILLIIRD